MTPHFQTPEELIAILDKEVITLRARVEAFKVSENRLRNEVDDLNTTLRQFRRAEDTLLARVDELEKDKARLIVALEAITRRVPIMTSRADYRDGQLHALAACSEVARAAIDAAREAAP